MRRIPFVFIFLISLLFSTSMAIPKKPVRLNITIQEKNQFTVFTAYCQNQIRDSITVSYHFKIEKTGKSGKSTNIQQGELKLSPGERKTCAVTRLVIASGDTCMIEGTINHQKEIIDQEKKFYIAN